MCVYLAKKTWSPAVCSGPVGARSYEVTTGEQVLTRNRRHLIQPDKQPELDLPDHEVDTEHNESVSMDADHVNPVFMQV